MTLARAFFASIGAVALAGCGSLIPPPQPDDLSTWRRAPIPPDPRLAAMAAEACRPLGENFVVQVVLQDRRTESTAAFLLAGPGRTGSCLTSLAGGGGAGWRSGPLEVMDDPIVVDERSYGDVADGTASILGGRTAADVDRVEIQLDDGEIVTASVGAGHWLAWWPGTVAADRITATSADGHVAVLAWRDGGWAIQ